jgi:methyl-accepting chemotaxis protein
MFGAATEGRRVPQNDIELGSFLRKCFPKSESHQMLQWRNNSASANALAQATAISKSLAVIEFNMDGTIVTANQNFLDTLGYRLEEIRGKHHSMFVAPNLRDSAEYRSFWANLNRGEYQSAEYKRLGKGGKEVWIQASYNPIFDRNGKPCKVIKFATANENFLKTLGYSLAEIKGKHHSMFVPPEDRQGDAYRAFWASLNRGEFQAAEYGRIGKGGRKVWIQASYNPIRDLNGQPCKVVKYATDVTKQVLARMGNERVRAMMETVAAGAEELNSSVREISEAMVKSKDTASAAVERVEVADQQAQCLSEAAGAMSNIVQLIGDITGQINLLALNATIESARAGEAGRGFAVVAAEVKNLANQAKQATDKIEQEIGNLNGISSDVVGALNSIKSAIQTVSEFVTSTAAAVEEQSTVAGEMSSSMQRAAAEAASISQAA